MFNAGKDAAPVPTIESLVNDSANFKVNSVPAQNFVIYPTQQFPEPTLISQIRMRRGSMKPLEHVLFSRETGFVISPCFGVVLKHPLPMPFMVKVATPT